MKYVLRALALAGIFGLGVGAAQAQTGVFVGFRTPRAAVVVSVPPCPGVGYVWVPGYYAGAVFVPGQWEYRGYDRVYVGGDDRRYEHGGFYRDDRWDDRGYGHRDFYRDDRRDDHGHDGYRDRR